MAEILAVAMSLKITKDEEAFESDSLFERKGCNFEISGVEFYYAIGS